MLANSIRAGRDAFADNPIIYQIFTDRFDAPMQEYDLEQVGSFLGGRLTGITRKLREGWFNHLGVNALLISAPFEQIRGWVPGGDGTFRHYGYHGYYALDYTVIDGRFGDEHDLRELVTVAHSLGIRVLLDVVLNHPGYHDLQSMHELGLNVLRCGWEGASPGDYWRHFDFDHEDFGRWWGPSWVRAALPGYPPGGEDDLTMLLAGLPDFRTEGREPVRLPQFLRDKANSRATDLPATTVRGYVIHWLAAWVRAMGIDGFRCDSAKHVELDAWFELKRAAQAAKEACSPSDASAVAAAEPFWMMGEVYGQGIDWSPYFDFGFDSLLNFNFQFEVENDTDLDSVYRQYAAKLSGNPGYNVVSYISSHDTHLFDRKRLIKGGTALLLAPGGVLMLYGDETARPPGPPTPGDAAQETRSPMNWTNIESHVLEHWRKLGSFRARHISISRGVHTKLRHSPYAFSRKHPDGDSVIVVPQAHGAIELSVAEVFQDGVPLHDAYSGWQGSVAGGKVVVPAAGCVLLERL